MNLGRPGSDYSGSMEYTTGRGGSGGTLASVISVCFIEVLPLGYTKLSWCTYWKMVAVTNY